jgi:hypothetical protein
VRGTFYFVDLHVYIMCCHFLSTGIPVFTISLKVKFKVQVEHHLTDMLGNRSNSDFTISQILKYMHIHNENLGGRFQV